MHADYILLTTLGLLFILGPLVKHLLRRVHLPPQVGYVGLGIAIALLDARLEFRDARFDQTFAVLAGLGIVALLFRVGLRSHLRALLDKLPDASLIWAGNVAASFALGYVVTDVVLGLPPATALVIATSTSATSVAVSVAVWDDMRLLETDLGALLVDVAELDDISAVVFLAILLAVLPVLEADGATMLAVVASTTGWTLAKLAAFVLGCYLFSYHLEEPFTQALRQRGASDTTLVITILGTGLVIAALAGMLGFSLAIGALFAGLAFSRDPDVVRSEGKFLYFYELFAPFFFINIGMQVDPEALWTGAGIGLLLFAVAALGKFAGTLLAAWRSAGPADAATLGISMVPRAEIGLLVLFACNEVDSRLVPPELFAGTVIASVLSCLAAPLLLRRRLARVAPGAQERPG